MWMHHIDADKVFREKARQELHKNAMSYIKQILEATSHKTTAVQTPISCIKNHPNKTNKACGALLVKQGQTCVMFF